MLCTHFRVDVSASGPIVGRKQTSIVNTKEAIASCSAHNEPKKSSKNAAVKRNQLHDTRQRFSGKSNSTVDGSINL